MPETYAFIEACREAFGKESITRKNNLTQAVTVLS